MRGNANGLTRRQLLPASTVARSHELRRNATDAEKLLWRSLREAFPEMRFRRQVPVGPYFADFCSHSARLIVESMAGKHAEAGGYDDRRTRFLEGEGYRVLRFWNNEVLENLDGTITTIAATFPSPLVGEGGAKRRMRGSGEA